MPLTCWRTTSPEAVWITHRKELAEQTCEMLRRDARVRVTIPSWTPGTPAPSIWDGVAVFMAQTASRRSDQPDIWNGYNDDDLMIIDEAHHAVAPGWERAIRQWPGRVLGMTATPWRLSRKEGFNRLFTKLVCGPQMADLQSQEFLCEALISLPPDEDRIQGGKISTMGDYTETGIEHANRNKEVMTARALEFWKEQAGDRQTIIYAVSVGHANNLGAVFNDAGITAEVILGDTNTYRRSAAIRDFESRKLQVLVNVAVATEGFDLPDASCVVIARPTKSLTLYLQMVGRGLRPKRNGGNCLVLDLAGNALEHGLPEEDRKWSLTARGQAPEGEAPVIWCEKCKNLSPASRHSCKFCGNPFGKDCQRCGKWRAWKNWEMEKTCKYAHEPVCDLCHPDAHVLAHLPDDGEGGGTVHISESEERLAPVIRELLSEERERLLAKRRAEQDKLQALILKEDEALEDNLVLGRQFKDYLAKLPIGQRPRNSVEEYRLFGKWESERRKVVADRKDELVKLNARPIDESAVFNSAQETLMRTLKSVSRITELSSYSGEPERAQTLHNDTSVTGAIDPLVRRRQKEASLLRFLGNQNTYTTMILEVLRKMGGEGKTKDVIEKVVEKILKEVNRELNKGAKEAFENFNENSKNAILSSIISKFSSSKGFYQKMIRQAHAKLQKEGLCDTYKPHGTWRLTA